MHHVIEPGIIRPQLGPAVDMVGKTIRWLSISIGTEVRLDAFALKHNVFIVMPITVKNVIVVPKYNGMSAS